jgi:choline transport protein
MRPSPSLTQADQ